MSCKVNSVSSMHVYDVCGYSYLTGGHLLAHICTKGRQRHKQYLTSFFLLPSVLKGRETYPSIHAQFIVPLYNSKIFLFLSILFNAFHGAKVYKTSKNLPMKSFNTNSQKLYATCHIYQSFVSLWTAVKDEAL